jgi:streptogramin lyase
LQARSARADSPGEWSTVQGIAITPDGVVWIADRNGNRKHLHVADADSAGNVYTGEATTGARIQKWKLIKQARRSRQGFRGSAGNYRVKKAGVPSS